MNTQKMKKICRPIRIIIGLALISYGLYSTSPLFTDATNWTWSWFYLGIFPLIAGMCDFCPTCLFTKDCDLPEPKEEKEPKEEN